MYSSVCNRAGIEALILDSIPQSCFGEKSRTEKFWEILLSYRRNKRWENTDFSVTIVRKYDGAIII